MCNCKWTEAIIGIVIFVMALWPNLLGASVSKWITVIAAVILLVHAFMCKSIYKCSEEPKTTKKKK